MVNASPRIVQGLDEFFKDLAPAEDRYHGFSSRMLCCKNVPARDPRFEYVKYFGVGVIEQLFPPTGMARPLIEDVELAFVFPENHMSQHERRELFEALKHADTPNLRLVDVITGDPMVIQLATKDGLWVIQDDKYYFGPNKNSWWHKEKQ